MNRRRHLLASSLMLLCAMGSTSSPGSARSGEQLMVFVQQSGSEVATRLDEDLLGVLQESVRNELGLELQVKDVADGVPVEVGLTPMFVFQNAAGRSFFQGRYVEPRKLVHFVRTSRVLPPADGFGSRQNLLLLESGRSRVGAPLKVTELAGDRPREFSPTAFQREAMDAIARGLSSFELFEEVDLGPADRLFYFDFYPHLSAAGELSVGIRLFSQFHCTQPVFERLDHPIRGAWSDRAAVFAAAAEALEEALFEVLATTGRGDGFDPVSEGAPIETWADLGLSLPEESARSTSGDQRKPFIELPREWQLGSEEEAHLFFRFPPPLERYSGEVRRVTGEFVLGQNGSLAGADGWVEVAVDSLTMGDPMLDEELHDKMLAVLDFPVSRLQLTSNDNATGVVAWGQLTPIGVSADFDLLGWTVPVEVTGQVEPVIGDDGLPRLHVAATFTISLWKPFGLEGPEGPQPARDRVEIHLDALLHSGSPSST